MHVQPYHLSISHNGITIKLLYLYHLPFTIDGSLSSTVYLLCVMILPEDGYSQ
jgi:hypothetical protein